MMTLVSTIESMTQFVQDDWHATQAILNKDTEQHALHLIQKICHERSKGKQLRSLMVLALGHLFNHCHATHHQLAAIVEVIHQATLLHDDVIDEATTRHNQPTAWSVYGNKASILVGDFMFSQSFRWISQLKDPFIIQSLANATQLIVEGEVEQHQVKGQLNLREATYFKIIEAKTAELFRQTTLLGAYAAGAHQKHQQYAEQFGKQIGIAFQLQDDLLDYVGSETGKSKGQDWSENKVTYPLIMAYAQAPEIIEMYFKEKRPFEDIEPIIQSTRAFQKTQSKIIEYTQSASEALNHLPDHPIKVHLNELINWMQYREF